ncbi:MAG TPA: RDD family protein [Acidimicrobiales bacterium]|jgi:uncharacterized RDD family membrane protein YckC
MTPPPSPPPPPPGGYGAAPQSGSGSPWGTLAEWGPRALGTLIDGGIGLAGFLVLFIVGVILASISSSLGLIVFGIAYLGVLGWQIWIATQVGSTGTSPGMRVMGLRCVGQDTGQTIGAGQGVIRWLCHIIDNLICYIGWLFPLWDAQKQTIADKVMHTVVIVVPKQGFSIAPPAGTAAY